MKKLLLLFIVLFSISVVAKEYESPMSIYKENYFICGDKEEDQVKFQVSAKYGILYPSNIGLYVAYTQLSSWHIFDKSSPFYDNNYQPEIFFKFESNNNPFNINLGIIDYIQASPIYHCSNGRDGDNSRSINTWYGQIQLSYGEVYNIGLNLKGFNYYGHSAKNKDIQDYRSYYEASIFFKIRSKSVQFLDKEELHFKFGGYDRSDYRDYKESQKDKSMIRGWFCVEAQVRIMTSFIQPKFFIQYYHGYSEFMIDYNKKTNAVRFGLVF
jgi:outer membrane phospholipase A